MKSLLPLSAVSVCAACSHFRGETVLVSGRVTDFDAKPVDGATVGRMHPAFDGRYDATTDADGRYCARIGRSGYTLEEPTRADWVWPEGETDVTYRN